MWPKQQHRTEGVGLRKRWPYVPTGARRNYDDDNKMVQIVPDIGGNC